MTQSSHAPDRAVRSAGLDVGWGDAVAMEALGGDRWRLRRTLPPGRYPFKFIMDGVWSYDLDLATIDDGDNINNVLEVTPPELSEADRFARARILQSGGRLTRGEAAALRRHLGVPER